MKKLTFNDNNDFGTKIGLDKNKTVLFSSNPKFNNFGIKK